jgi:hypothetical protein
VTAALLVALLAAATAPAAEPRAVDVRVSKREVRLGEPFELAVELRHRPDERYALPAAPGVEPFRVLAGACPRRPDGADVVTACTLRLALFDLGAHPLPELVLEVATPEGARELRIPGPTITGIGVLDPAAPPEALALRDLAPPVPLMVPHLALAFGALALALVAAGAAWGWRAWRHRARRAAEPPAPLPPHERFARQLDALAEARLAERGQAREHLSRLSEHVREYLGAITGQNALDLTSTELLARLAWQPDPRLDLDALRAFLEAADLVKFARAPAGADEAGEGLAFARALLERSRPAPAPPGSPT